FPGVGAKAAGDMAKQIDGGAYDGARTPVDFAQGLNVDLFAGAHDKHLHVQYREPGAPAPGGPAMVVQQRLDNFGFAKLEHLAGNVGYLKLEMFAEPAAAGDTAAAAMRF